MALVTVTANSARAQVLTHGPVVGGVTDTGAKVFVRTSQAADVTLEYGTDPNLGTYSLSTTVTTSGSSDYTAIIPLSDLSAESTVYLNVMVDGVAQLSQPPYPSFATFAPSGASRTFQFLVLSDFVTVRDLDRDVQTFTNAAATNPAFVFIGGDFDHRNPSKLDTKRSMFKDLYDPATLHMSGFVPLILQKMGMIHQWDDHDAGLNNCDRTYSGWALTQQAFQEYVPTYPLPSVTPGIWQKFSYAQMDGFVLDCRSQRDPEFDPDDANKSMLDGNNLGATGQLQWLEGGLLGSTAKWKVIFSSVVTNPSTKVPDGWGGYQTEWNALKNFILTNQISGVVFISGDLHLAAIDNGTAAGFPEMCIPQPNSTKVPMNCATAANGRWSEGYYDETCSGFGLVSIMENPDRLLLQTVDEFGTIRLSYTVSDSLPTPTPTPTPPPPPLIKKQPTNQKAYVGQSATFRTLATGAPPLSYQWNKNGTPIDGATSNIYTTPPAVITDNGSLFSAIVSNPGGSITSNSAKLTVRAPP
ncbi:MAG TPA: alkaline phosphatase D family protein [Chthoniobacterales bacterium]|jgi:alkaline phosphatase D